MPVYTISTHTPVIDSSAFIAPTASVIGDVRIGRNSSVWFGAVVRGDMNGIRIGDFTSIQDLTLCHVDTHCALTVGSNVTVGHSCILHGCTVEDDCLIGMGATLMNGAVVGRGSIVAAGSLVLENAVIPPCSLVVGVPGKVKRTFREIPELIATASAAYQDLVRQYTEPCGLIPIVDHKL